MRKKIKRNRGIVIIGAGALGTALAHAISHKGHKVSILTRDAFKASSINNQDVNVYVDDFADIRFPFGKVSAYIYDQFPDVLADAGIIILTVPSSAIAETLELIKENLTKKQRTILVITSKGADSKTGETPYRFAQREFRLYPLVSVVVASVVGFAIGIARKEITKILISSRPTSSDANRIVKTLLSTRYLITEKSFDPNGACLSGLLKNVGAIMIGMCEGIKDYTFSNGEKITIGENSRWAFVDEWSNDMVDIAKALGIKKSTVEGLVGKIDLGLSSSSSNGRNWKFGYRLAKGENMERIINSLGTIEGIGAARYLNTVVDSKYISTLVKVLDKVISPIEAVGIVLNDNNSSVTQRFSDEDFLLSAIRTMGVL